MKKLKRTRKDKDVPASPTERAASQKRPDWELLRDLFDKTDWAEIAKLLRSLPPLQAAALAAQVSYAMGGGSRTWQFVGVLEDLADGKAVKGGRCEAIGFDDDGDDE